MGTSERYEITELLGKGGTGLVYKAWDHFLKRYVALKRFRMDQSGEPSSVSEAAMLEAFHLAAFEHPNILAVHDAGIDEQGPFLITRLLHGQTLLEFIRAYGVYKMRAFKNAVRQTLEGLAAAHFEGVLHLDLKPGNIMVSSLPSSSLHYVILDFGLARLVGTQKQPEEGNSVFGSAPYLAPEQIVQGPLDQRTDLYSMGCMYYFMLAGAHAFQGNTVQGILQGHLDHNVIPLQLIREDLPDEVCDWVMKLISRNPDHRPPSAVEALNEFLDTVRNPGWYTEIGRAVFRRFASMIQPIPDHNGRPEGKTLREKQGIRVSRHPARQPAISGSLKAF